MTKEIQQETIRGIALRAKALGGRAIPLWSVHLEVLEAFLEHAKESNFTVLGITYSPIRGPEGNIEYLGYLRHGQGTPGVFSLPEIVEASHSQLKD